jgi:microcystin degradation protein MlrC
MRKRVLSASFKHETNTFSKLPTDLDAFRVRALHTGAAIAPVYLGTNTEIAAHFDAAAENDWDMVSTVVANAVPSGKVTREAWQHISGILLAALDESFDGILLALHGAMVTEVDEDGEGALLEAVREKVGQDVPICVSLDLHANVTEQMARHANGLFSFRTYPHIDTYDSGRRAAAALQAAMSGTVKPRCLVAKRPQIDGANHGRSQDGPMIDLLRRCKEHGDKNGIVDVSVNGGFPWADIEWAGPSVTVTYDEGAAGAVDRAREIAESMMDTIWEERANVTIKPLSVSDAMAHVKSAGEGDKPIVLADFADNPGGGSYGDNPTLLAGMIEADLQNAVFGTISDPDAVIACQRAGVRGTVTIPLGGKIDPDFVPPLTVTGEVVAIAEGSFTYEGPMSTGLRSSMGPTVILRIGGIDVIITTSRLQVLDLAIFRSQGIDPEEKAVVAVKSAHHFRGAFQPIAREILLVDALGLATPSLKSLNYENVRRPVWPLDGE